MIKKIFSSFIIILVLLIFVNLGIAVSIWETIFNKYGILGIKKVNPYVYRVLILNPKPLKAKGFVGITKGMQAIVRLVSPYKIRVIILNTGQIKIFNYRNPPQKIVDDEIESH
ncbi:MAG: hypothetical protein DRG20_04570 [Deltaproteobacteria bacterium]|nr:hypothetical protein [Deltaproteobacteria bacterium]RLA89541.1 MAG: hypothetical protein DRG20_04570 [Deltaproteobacteria bacterium]